MMQMRRPSVDDMLQNKITRYSLVIAVAKRAREISAENAEMGVIVDETPVLTAIRDFENH